MLVRPVPPSVPLFLLVHIQVRVLRILYYLCIKIPLRSINTGEILPTDRHWYWAQHRSGLTPTPTHYATLQALPPLPKASSTSTAIPTRRLRVWGVIRVTRVTVLRPRIQKKTPNRTCISAPDYVAIVGSRGRQHILAPPREASTRSSAAARTHIAFLAAQSPGKGRPAGARIRLVREGPLLLRMCVPCACACACGVFCALQPMSALMRRVRRTALATS